MLFRLPYEVEFDIHGNSLKHHVEAVCVKILVNLGILAHKGQCGSVIASSLKGENGVHQLFDSLSEKVLNSVMEKFGIPEKERKYRLVFYFSGINSVVEKWIGGGCTESVPEIADLISMVILPVGEEEREMLRRIFSDVL